MGDSYLTLQGDFEAAVGITDSSLRIAHLRMLLTKLVNTGHDPDHIELLAVVKAELCRLGDLPVGEAKAAVKEADRIGRKGWANFYLAEAAIIHDDPSLALHCIRRVPEGFFESRDLLWRAVRLLEIQSVAWLRLGNLQRAESLAVQVESAIATHGFTDDLVAPVTLVGALLEMVEDTDSERANFAYRVLHLLFMTMSPEDWFSPEVASTVRAVLTRKDSGCGAPDEGI